ncbi:MAG: hypothetical protein V4719_22920 [Planctomycetota bacterium]
MNSSLPAVGDFLRYDPVDDETRIMQVGLAADRASGAAGEMMPPLRPMSRNRKGKRESLFRI